MIIRLAGRAGEEQIRRVVERIESQGLAAEVVRGSAVILVTVLGDSSRLDAARFRQMEGVDGVERLSGPYPLVGPGEGNKPRCVRVGGLTIGGGPAVILAGPCAVESRAGTVDLALELKRRGAQILRGGAYKPRTSPYSFQGMGQPGLLALREARAAAGLPVVTEVTGTHHHLRPDGTQEERSVLDQVLETADLLQIGSRNMKSYGLLQEVARKSGRAGKPVLLKRGEAATLEEFLLAAEYLALFGNPEVILCLRGIRTFETGSWQRYTSDIAAIAVLKRESRLPVIFDPSHATGDRRLVHAVSLAAVAAGADGLLIETHADPREAQSDGLESVTPAELQRIVEDVRRMESARGQIALPR